MQTNTAVKYNTFPEQRVKDSVKKKEDWYIPFTNYIIDRAEAANNKSETLENLDAANGIISNNTIKYALQPYSKDITDQHKQLKFPNTIREIDYITPLKERYMGEYIKQYHNYQVYIHNADSVFLRNEQLAKAVKAKLVQKFEELLETGDEGVLENLDIEQFSKDFITEWADERVIKGQERLNLINDLTNAVVKYIQGFFYWWACEEVYSYRTVISNELITEIVPPWEYYRVPSGNMFVEDDDMGMRKYKISINKIIDYFREDLSEKDIQYIRSIASNQIGDVCVVGSHLLQDRKAFDIYRHSNISSQSGIDFTDSSRLVTIYHCVAKTETLIYKLKYIDYLTGEVKEVEVSQTYKLNEAAGDISLEEDWINEVYHSYRIGGKVEGVYIPAKPVDVQRQEVNNSSICKLPYNGIKGLLSHSRINPIPKRSIVYQALLRLYNYQREKAISKFKTFNLIPESLILDSDEMTMEERFTYAAIDDILPFNDTDIEPSVVQAIKNLYNQGAERYIQILTEVIETLKREMMDMANMNEQRYGDINPQAGKSVTEYAITKATTGSILMFEMYNKFRERDYMANLDYSKAAWIDGKKDSYIDPNTKEVVYVDIDGVADLGTNYGVFVRNSALEEEKLKMYREVAFAASQNGEFGLAVDAIHSENSTEIRRLIKKADEANKEYQRNVENARNEMQEKLANAERELEEANKLHDKEIVHMKESAATDRKMAELEVAIKEIELKFNQPVDTDIPQEYMMRIKEADIELKKQKLELEKLKVLRQQKEE